MTTDPKIYLAIDNCFASKRWTRPLEWMQVIKEIGINFVEASADTECDPLYMGPEFTRDWIRQVEEATNQTGVRVINLYSGHGTYATLGLSHYDPRVRKRFCDDWLKAQADTANALGAGLGFFTHAFNNDVLQSNESYRAKLEELYDSLAEVAKHARKIGMQSVGVEQMYVPHQAPWTIAGAWELIKEVYARGGAPFYITLDVGHMNGQQYFQLPSKEAIRLEIQRRRLAAIPSLWVGTERAFELVRMAAEGEMPEEDAIQAILEDCEKNPQLFASPEDCSVYRWVEALGAYSPIIHLQQSNGKSSPHWPFDPAHNAKGIIDGKKLIQSLAKAFSDRGEDGLPPQCSEIALTLEPFIGTAGNIYAAKEELKASVSYWRQFVPKDGMRLSEIMDRLSDC